MVIVLEEYTTEERRSVMRFLWAKGLNANDIHKAMFPVYGGKCLPCKAVHSWVEKRGKRFADDEEVETELQKWLKHRPKDFYALVKRWNECVSMLVQDMLRNKSFFPYSNITCFTFYIHVTYLLTLPRLLL
jgi:hypothetical protein